MAAASVAVGGVSLRSPPSRRLTLNLVTFMIGVTVKSQAEANVLAVRHGSNLSRPGQDFLTMSADDLARLRDQMKRDGLVWGAGFLQTTRGQTLRNTTRRSKSFQRLRLGCSAPASIAWAHGSARPATA